MVPTNDYYPDRSYIFAFLLSSRLFIKPYQLLSKIWDLSQTQQNIKSFIQVSVISNRLKIWTKNSLQFQQKLAQKNPNLAKFTQHLIRLLAEWVDTFPYDFRDERLMTQIRDITQTCIQINPHLRSDVSQLLQNLLQNLQSLEKYEEYLEKLNHQSGDEIDHSIESNGHSKTNNGLQQQISVSSSHSHKSNSSTNSVASNLMNLPDISEVCSSPLLLAHQLTHIELERLSYIGPEEFVQAFTKDHPSIETSFKDLKKTRNLESYVQWFNRLSYLVATDVVKVRIWTEIEFYSANLNDFLFAAPKKEATSTTYRILDWNCPRIVQYRQFQQSHGNHRRLKHVSNITSQENGK